MIIGIVGYFTVPTVANYIVHAGGGNSLLYKVTNIMSSSSRTIVEGARSSTTSMVKDVYGDVKGMMSDGMTSKGNDYFRDKISGK